MKLFYINGKKSSEDTGPEATALNQRTRLLLEEGLIFDLFISLNG